MEKKTFRDFKNELAVAYGSNDYRRDFEIGSGISKLLSEDEFYDSAAERYAYYMAKKAWDEGYERGIKGDYSATNPYKQ